MKENFECILSIIVPLYQGAVYINNIITQIKAASLQCKNIKVELLFVNDYPDEKIDIPDESDISIKIVENESNMGIHASRVIGLKNAKGKYVLFLDQDDYIYPEYIKFQFECIKDADAVVCRLKNGNRIYYTDLYDFNKVITKEFMLNNWCSIVSPGQVLIKKSSIPKEWMENIVNNNGADDYFLWILMLCMGRRIVLNDRLLYEHRLTGNNASYDTNKMMDSEDEIIQKLLKMSCLKVEDKNKLYPLKESLRRMHIKQLDSIRTAYMVVMQLMNIKADTFYKVFGNCVAIYGASYIGDAFYTVISQNENINLIFIDQNAKYISSENPIYELKTVTKDVKTAIIAVNGDIGLIKKDIEQALACRVLTISQAMELCMQRDRI